MSRQAWQEALWWATADGTAIATSTTETIIFPNVTIPANYMQDGRVLRITARGRVGNVVTAVPTMTWRVRWGGVSGTVLAASAAISASATAFTSAIWSMYMEIVTRTNGATGTLLAIGEVWGGNFGTVAPNGMGSAGATVPAAVTADLTADTALALTFQWGTSNASNTLQGHNYFGEAMN